METHRLADKGITTLPQVISEVKKLAASPFAAEIESKKEDFKAVGKSGYETLFSELCFCLLAANTSAEMALRTQMEIGEAGFLSMGAEDLSIKLKRVKYRFYNVRSKFIVLARPVAEKLPSIVNSNDPSSARAYLVDSVLGIGYKEASHFLRNTGVFNFAILDKHIQRMFLEGEKGRNMVGSAKRYLEAERDFISIAEEMSLEPGILDLYMWKIATGRIIK